MTRKHKCGQGTANPPLSASHPPVGGGGRRNEKPSANQSYILHTAFTLPDIRMLKDALSLVEISLSRQINPLPNTKLATETVEGLKNKFSEALEREEWGEEIAWDYNELHILYAAVCLYLARLKINHESSLMAPCVRLCQQFSVMVAYVESRRGAG